MLREKGGVGGEALSWKKPAFSDLIWKDGFPRDMRIALLIIILSKEKAGGSGLIFFLFLSLPSLACKVLANILATQFKDPTSALVSNVMQLSPAVVTCQHLMLGISQMYLLHPWCTIPSEEEV